ncbi:Heat shock protein 12B [Monoraphidium neglectum]|uniref:Heat shock protein 12B n=1 Tax=Monoraphidium neglectum TaxID=145388 RepID=A0A0D2JU35_9CHLO|nr:Heat shock protein 12B [Monoraphidium neglectum]KIZ02428.1 Heat shock protein 12B [Monoraphidium neglectum]|eukprot:XP_013901447.1 Heat shock protein 12B [Monoraphidium neglectum]
MSAQGQYVGVDEEVRHIFGTTYPCQTAADVRVYCTPKACEEFISDPGMRRLGAVRLEMPPPHTEGSRELEVVFKFGGAEIEVTAADVVSGKEVRASLQFLTGV